MHYFIDRRPNPKDKSLGNRRRFMRRARERLKKVVEKSISHRSIKDLDKGENVTIPTKGIEEHRFHNDGRTGARERVFPGNKEFVPGDTIPRPPSGDGGKGSGKEGSDSGESQDEFSFTLTRDEFLDLFFEDLELPDLMKKSMQDLTVVRHQHAGYRSSGSPANISMIRTMRQSLSRRIALKRPGKKAIEELEAEIADVEDRAPESDRLKELKEELEIALRRRKFVTFIDPLDVRYHAFEDVPVPNSKAVMFCLMDVSGSMGEREKDLAKRFFMLLHLFLERRYERIEVVFIRHTHIAQEVDEDTFFYDRVSGGTVVSQALEEMEKVLKDRYPTDIWNIYAAQVSDGDNTGGDSRHCINLLNEALLPLCQYYTYIEVVDELEMEIASDDGGSRLWKAYRPVQDHNGNFAMAKVATPGDIFPVFRSLFAKKQAAE